MSLDVHPWLALLLGVIIGVLFGWLLESWCARRRRPERHDLLAAEGGPQAIQADLRAAPALVLVEPAAAAVTESPMETAGEPEAAADETGSTAAAAPLETIISPVADADRIEAGATEGQRAACPQVLSRVHGVGAVDFKPLAGLGSVFEGRLYDAGICTYAALANATVEQLAQICQAPAWRTPDYASWIAEARARLAR
jgi:predicted flap endonuclease-1-like 5' DNA nuclease